MTTPEEQDKTPESTSVAGSRSATSGEHGGERAQPAGTDGGGSASGGRRRLRHRLPVRLRHHWKLAALIIAGCLALALLFGSSMVRPFITSELTSADAITDDIEGEKDLFDESGHSIEITFDQAAYEDMIRTFQEEGEKDWIRADITIDDTVIEDVGLRLKGNSTLSSLRGEDGQGPGGMPGGGAGGDAPQMPEGAEMPEGAQAPDGARAPEGAKAAEDGGQVDAGDEDAAGGRRGGMGGMMFTQLSEDDPQELPWLISFEEFQEGRAYQGNSEIALRPAAGGSDAALNEALALEMTAESGQITQDSTFGSVTVNGGESAARLVVDAPDAAWADSLGDGVLYKARAGGSLEYVGDDPTDYEESFSQINAEGSYDLQPVMDLLKFLDEVDDEEFAREIDDHLDVESFAEYLATQEILSNWDAMDGAGNNYYLWYDTEEERFTVLSWDLNLALSGMGGGAPAGEDGEAAEGPGGGQDVPQPQEGEDMPEMPGGGEEGAGGGPGGNGSGLLKERFLENEEFVELYEQAYTELYADLVDSGFAAEKLEALTERASAVGDAEAGTVSDSLAEQLASIPADPPDPAASSMGGPAGRG
jgi:spore coat protein CotH